MLSVIIPVTPARIGEVGPAIESARQPGTEVIVVVDGPWDGDPLDGADATLVLDRNVGAGTARVAGALHASCDLLFFLDSDDQMLPGAAVRARDDLAEYAAVLYRLEGVEPEYPAGVLAPGTVADLWLARGITSHAAAVTVRRDVFFAAGAYPGLPRMEDWLFWAAVNERHPVLVSDFVARTYTRHPGQVTEAPWPGWVKNLAAVWIPSLVAQRRPSSPATQ